MVHSPALLDQLQAASIGAWSGRAFRHMFADYPPEAENVRGARWNPPGTPAIYTSLTREGVIAEAEYQLSLQPVRPRVGRTVYEIEVKLENVVDLSDAIALKAAHVDDEDLGADNMRACQETGAAAAWLQRDGLLIPSARSQATNLVIYATNTSESHIFTVLSSEVIAER